jgi:elongation factor P--(R)-beta-lysine ligase
VLSNPGNLNLSALKSNLWSRAGIIQSIRYFFVEQGFLEVETPNLIPAPVPEAHIDLLPTKQGFLHASPEQCMKRLLSEGFRKIFQICKCYRDGERGHLHLPEFTLLEWYRADADYTELMTDCEAMVCRAAHNLGMGNTIQYRDGVIDIKPPWERITVQNAFDSYSPVPLKEALESGRFDEMTVLHIEPSLNKSKPVFLYDYPAPLASLARLKQTQPEVAERFELYMGGIELANAFSELIDPTEQETRFKKENDIREKHGKERYPLPEKFLEALKTMPPSAGIAFGIDRLVMLLTGSEKIDDVVSFTPEEL